MIEKLALAAMIGALSGMFTAIREWLPWVEPNRGTADTVRVIAHVEATSHLLRQPRVP